jgi:hypothetical protein
MFHCQCGSTSTPERFMNEGKSRVLWNAIACGGLAVVILGLLVATWMPAIVAARQKRVAATTQPTVATPPPATSPTE